MAYISVDVETDGPCPSLYSMISFGAVLVRNTSQTFYGKLRPVSEYWIPEALAVSGFSREETLKFDDPAKVMNDFSVWMMKHVFPDDRPIFISDNNGFDWQFINWYFWKYIGKNPFGHSSQNLGSLYKGCVKDMSKNFKYLRTTKHTHNPVDDATGNAEALIKIQSMHKLKIKL